MELEIVDVQSAPMQTECVKGPWSSEEDEMLMELVKKYGPKRWTLISRLLKGRVGKQCRERWHNHLNPNVNKSAWTHEEDLILVRAHRQLGNQWAKIAQFLPGRTDNAIKNRWNSSLRRWKQQRSTTSHLSGTSDGEDDLVLPCEDGGSSQGSLESVSASSQVSATREDSSWSTSACKVQLASPEHQSSDSAFWDTTSEMPSRMENDDGDEVSLVEVAQDDKEPPIKVECGEPVEDTNSASSSADYILPDVSLPPEDDGIIIEEESQAEEDSESDIEEIAPPACDDVVISRHSNETVNNVGFIIWKPRAKDDDVIITADSPAAATSPPREETETVFDKFAKEVVAAELNSLPYNKAILLQEGIRWFIKAQKEVLKHEVIL